MPYATAAQVQSEFPDIEFGASTKVTSDDVDRFILEADAEINTRLSAYYQVPITGTEALVVVRMIGIWLVKHRINGIMKVKAPVTKADQGGDGDLRQQALDMLKELADGTIKLSDAAKATSHEGVKSYTSTEETEHVFQIGEVQW